MPRDETTAYATLHGMKIPPILLYLTYMKNISCQLWKQPHQLNGEHTHRANLSGATRSGKDAYLTCCFYRASCLK